MMRYCVLIFVFPGISFFGCRHQAENIPHIQKGEINLTVPGFNIEKSGPIALDGEWEFYWGELKSQSDDFPKTPETKINYIPLPGYWNGFSVDGHNIPHLGYASYHLKIQTDGKSRMYAVRMTDLLSAYTLFADGEIIGKNGNVGKSEKEEIPEWKPSVHSFYSDKRTIHLVLQVSNFHHRLGGIWESIQFGTNTNLLSVRAKNIAIELFLFGSLLIIGLYHLQTFLLRRKEIDLFYFGLYSASFAFRSLVIGERFILEIFPSLNWNCIVRMDYLFPYVLLPLNAAYVFYLFPGYFSRRVLIMEVVVTSITALFVLVTMPLYFSHIAPYFSLFMLLCIFYHMFVYIHVAFKKREGYELLIGGIVVFFATVHDIFRYNFAFDSVNLAEYGVFIFILLQAYYLSKRYATSINKLEEMKEKEKFTFIGQIASEIVHDINNHCQLLFEYSRTKDRETRPALKARLGQIKKEAGYLKNMALDILDSVKEKIIVRKEILNLEDYALLIQEDMNLFFYATDVKFELSLKTKGSIQLDGDRFRRLILNLAKNSFEAMPKGGKFQIQILKESNLYYFRFEDTGKGMSREIQEKIFVPLFTQNKLHGTGLGLMVVKRIVDAHGGTLAIQSTENQGTRITIAIP